MSQMVGNDPQFSSMKILRPYSGFETVYAGAGGKTLLMWQEGAALDAMAGKPGYSPNLIAGLSVPYGAKLSIWLPVINTTQTRANSGIPESAYVWRIMFRTRNLRDYRLSRKPFHMPRQQDGIADSSASAPTARVTIPACVQTVLNDDGYFYPGNTSQGRRLNALTIQDLYLRREDPFIGATTFCDSPLLTGGLFGEIQQGCSPISAFWGDERGKQYRPSWYQHSVEAAGDELLIGCYKSNIGSTDPTPGNAAWNFTTDPDNILSALYGSDVDAILPAGVTGPFPSIGVYVLYGKGAT